MEQILASHPYADAWPMLGEEDLAALTEDVATNGLRDPIVLYDGKILDGRNRYAACAQACVAPVYDDFHGDDDDALAYVQSVNNARRHQSKGSLAASWALSMLAAGKREDGRWAYGSVDSQNSGKADAEMRRICGLIADHAPDLLVKVRDDEMSLHAAHDAATRERDRERDALAQAERIEAEEADALAHLQSQAPEYAARIGTDFPTARQAFTAWEDENRREAARLRQEKAAAEKEERELDRGREDTCRRISESVRSLGGGARYAETFLTGFYPHEHRFLHQRERLTTTNVDEAIEFLTTLRKALP